MAKNPHDPKCYHGTYRPIGFQYVTVVCLPTCKVHDYRTGKIQSST